MVNKIPCKNFFCHEDRVSGSLYCSGHSSGKPQIDDLEEASKYTRNRFKENESFIISHTEMKNGSQTSYVHREQWNWLIRSMARAWDVDKDKLERGCANRLYSEYGQITYA